MKTGKKELTEMEMETENKFQNLVINLEKVKMENASKKKREL